MVIAYSSRGLSPPGVRLAAVTGEGVMPFPVRPMPGMSFQPTPGAVTAFV